MLCGFAMRHMIRVYPLPPQLLTSPYLDQLYAPMDQTGIQVCRMRPRRSILALLARHGPRILHMHFFDELTQRRAALQTAARSLAFLALLAALRLRGVHLIWTAHNLEPHELYHPAWGLVVYRCVIRWSTAIIAHSQAARATLEARYGPLPQCAVIPHGSYIDLYGPPRDQAQSRAALGLPVQGPVLMNLGTLRPYKGIEDLIAAFARLPEHQRGTLLIAGAAKDPAYVAALQSQATGIAGVRLRPQFIPDDELPTYLAAADIVVLPYRSLLTSGILLWALSYARPVIAPAFGPVCEIVREGQAGFLFTPGDQEALRAALERALAHPNLAHLGMMARQVARAFDWSDIAAATAACYRQVCQ